MVNKVLFSSKNTNWETPQWLFDALNAEFNFTLDPCADDKNHKCPLYFTEEDDGLVQNWGTERVFCNPPYGRHIGDWVQKCSAHKGVAVLLIPARTDTQYFHDFIYRNPRAEIRFIRGRLRFVGADNAAPFPSMIVIFRGAQCYA